ncbi:alpha-N-acetylglucosaminidase [Akkermansia sp. N21169]|uniref:alpha-N-acetylglucosaminidase n=1 Tax=Akkermansia sp. N21169 TaxID=3040765 RepID=UPI00244EBBF5|nr:alpha-N-acetylglucosaminidase [Akkermansia sp. N21169]MDH3069610.1 alpha-N-acetylglucosaminidase [Akkermansia sp. N21169]
MSYSLLTSCFLAASAVTPVIASAAAVPASVSALIARTTPQLAKQFKLQIDPSMNGFRITPSTGGFVSITAGNVNELTAGYGYYLRHVLGVHWSWNGNRMDIPNKAIMPQTPIEVKSPWKWRYAYNYCTLSYTMGFWGPKEWQAEIDRMALNGVNIALVQAGLEKVWQLTLRDLGYPEDKIRAFIPNPSAAAWWNMGNLEGMSGPISQDVIDREAQLGKAIVSAMESYGMTPVLQGFVGLVPHDLEQYLHGKDAHYIPQGEWCGQTRPIVLDPTCPAFAKVASIWYKNLQKVYGISPKALGGDLFHEGGNSGGVDIQNAATAVQKSMHASCPQSIWLLQAWGGNPRKELMDGLNQKYVLVLALDRDMSSPFREGSTNAYKNAPWIWTELLNFGGNHGLYGSLKKIASLGAMQQFANKDNLQGLGLISEGVETNPMYYEFFFQRLWSPKEQVQTADEISSWMKTYAQNRYGSAPEPVLKGLQLLERSVYSPQRMQEGCTESILCARPGRNVQKASTWSSGQIYYNTEDVINAAAAYLQAARENPELLRQETFRYDLIDILRQMISDMARPLLAEAMQAYDSGDKKEFEAKASLFLDLINNTDQLLGTYPQWRFGQMYERAIAKGRTPEEKNNMAMACKRLVTTWSGHIDGLNDYSHRQLAGLMKDFYGKRWQLFFDSYRQGLEGKLDKKAVDGDFRTRDHAFELGWEKQPASYSSKPEGNLAQIAQQVFDKFEKPARQLAKSYSKLHNAPKWTLKDGATTLTFDVSGIITAPGTYKATFLWKSGNSALEISKVTLYEGSKIVAVDEHPGWTGIENKRNTYTLPVEKLRTNLDSYTIKAEVKGASGTDSSGVFIFDN